MIVTAPGTADELEAYLAEAMQDPAFRAAYEAAGRRFRRSGGRKLAVDGQAYQRRQRARRWRRR